MWSGPAALLAGAALFVAPTATNAFTLLGFNLGLGQRDLRVFNNFTDATANNNTTPHAMYPGYDGAEMAMWKGAVEWRSRPEIIDVATDLIRNPGRLLRQRVPTVEDTVKAFEAIYGD